jgi:hypothetical protein
MKRGVVILAFALLALPTFALASPPSKAASANCKAQLQAIGKTDFARLHLNMGACISQMSQATKAQQQATLNAARGCRTEQRADSAAFEQKYGSNHSKENAFGKCVSLKVRAAPASH